MKQQFGHCYMAGSCFSAHHARNLVIQIMAVAYPFCFTVPLLAYGHREFHACFIMSSEMAGELKILSRQRRRKSIIDVLCLTRCHSIYHHESMLVHVAHKHVSTSCFQQKPNVCGIPDRANLRYIPISMGYG